MISVKEHKAHHQHPHEEDFCLIGVCNPILQVMFKMAGHLQYVWLTLFIGCCAFDNYILSAVLKSAVSNMGSSSETWHAEDGGLPGLYKSMMGEQCNSTAGFFAA